jgi:hypothetical protein
MAAAFAGVAAQAPADDLMTTTRSPAPVNVSAASTRFRESLRTARIDNWAVQRADGKVWALGARAGEVLNVNVGGTYAPTCAMRLATLPVAGKKDGVKVVIDPKSDTGPEGFAVTWTGSNYESQSVDNTHTDTTTKDIEGWLEICLKTGIGPSSPMGSIQLTIDACVKASAGRHWSDSEAHSNNKGEDGKQQIALTNGLRSTFAPFPEYPVGALLLVETGAVLPDDGSPPPVPNQAEFPTKVHVLTRQTSIVFEKPTVAYLVVNDARIDGYCPAPDATRELTVTTTLLEPVGNRAAQLGKGMAKAIGTLDAETGSILATGRFLPEDRTWLRSKATVDLQAACGGCNLAQFPAAFMGFFDAWVNLRVSRIERLVEIESIERRMRAIELELRGLADQSVRYEGMGSVLQLLPEWALDGLAGNQLRPRIHDLLEDMNVRVYPVLKLRYPSLLSIMEGELAPYVDKLTSVDWAAGIDVHAALAKNTMKAFDGLWTDYIQDSSSTETEVVAIAFYNPAYKLPPEPAPDNYVPPPDTLPPFSQSSVRRADETRSLAVWQAINRGVIDPASPLSDITRVPFTVQLKDLYAKQVVNNTLRCEQATPVIKTMSLVLEKKDGSPAWNANPASTSTSLGSEQLFPNAVGVEHYQVVGEGLKKAAVRVLIGAVGQTVKTFKDFGLDTHASEGLSPFSNFTMNLDGLQSKLADTKELILVFQVEVQTVDGPMTWIPGCK